MRPSSTAHRYAGAAFEVAGESGATEDWLTEAVETKLDGAFAKGTITPESLQATTADIAARQGRLRYVHLSAHIAAKGVLTPAQTAAYAKLRGYGEHGGQHHHEMQ